MWVVLRREIALVASDFKDPLIHPVQSLRCHQGFASFPLIVDPRGVPTTWVMGGSAWKNQPSRGLRRPNQA